MATRSQDANYWHVLDLANLASEINSCVFLLAPHPHLLRWLRSPIYSIYFHQRELGTFYKM